MDNKTKILIGLGLVGIGGYLYWKSTQKKANVSGTKAKHGQALTKKNLTSSNCQCNKK